jgi:hypothetical protein
MRRLQERCEKCPGCGACCWNYGKAPDPLYPGGEFILVGWFDCHLLPREMVAGDIYPPNAPNDYAARLVLPMTDPIRMTAHAISGELDFNEIDAEDVFVDAPSYDAVVAELAAMTKDRDYHRAATMQQSQYWRGVHEERIRALETRIAAALNALKSYGGIGGEHHKTWVIDQVARALVVDYSTWVIEINTGEDGPNTYSWEVGIPP